MTRQEHLLIHWIEECAEVQQRVTKAMRFGMEEKQRPGTEIQYEDNRTRIIQEFNDLVGVMEMAGFHLAEILSSELIGRKMAKVEKYLLHARTCGTLTES